MEIELPNAGRVSGLGVPRGVTLIVGGGFHGKSTLLHALERGVYDHIPGDGRERVVTVPDAVKIRAEDGRRIAGHLVGEGRIALGSDDAVVLVDATRSGWTPGAVHQPRPDALLSGRAAALSSHGFGVAEPDDLDALDRADGRDRFREAGGDGRLALDGFGGAGAGWRSRPPGFCRSERPRVYRRLVGWWLVGAPGAPQP